MDLKGIALEKLFTQEEVYERIEEYEKKQKAKIKKAIEDRDAAKEQARKDRDSGISRIIITENPRPSNVRKVEELIPEEVEEPEEINETIEFETPPLVEEQTILTKREELLKKKAEIEAMLAKSEEVGE